MKTKQEILEFINKPQENLFHIVDASDIEYFIYHQRGGNNNFLKRIALMSRGQYNRVMLGGIFNKKNLDTVNKIMLEIKKDVIIKRDTLDNIIKDIED